MTFNKILIVVVMSGMVIAHSAQAQETAPVKPHRWAVYGGIGPNYYFNNLVIAKDKVTELNYSIVGRLMWEPEYFLSLGFETGYNRLYTVNVSTPTNGTGRIVNVAIPIQFVVSMKFFKHYYACFNVGQSILLNNVSTSNFGDFDASVVSFGDFSATFGYRRNISERFLLGVELKGYHSSKLEDTNLALVFMSGYRLW